MWIYLRTAQKEIETFTVGYFDPEGTFRRDSDWTVRQDAANRVHFLCGGDQVAPDFVEQVYHITTSGTVTVATQTVSIQYLLLEVTNAGTNWTFSVQNKASTPNAVIAPILLNPPGSDVTGKAFYPPYPLLMEGGIDIVTNGATAGVIDVWVAFSALATPNPTTESAEN